MVSLGLNLKINTLHGQMLCVVLMGSSRNMRMHYVLHSTRGSTGNGSLERACSFLDRLVEALESALFSLQQGGSSLTRAIWTVQGKVG